MVMDNDSIATNRRMIRHRHRARGIRAVAAAVTTEVVEAAVGEIRLKVTVAEGEAVVAEAEEEVRRLDALES